MIKNKKKALLITVITLIVAIFVGSCIFYFDMKSISTSIGEGLGTAVGAFTGSFDGITEGMTAGKAEGQKAEDTEVELNDIKTMGKLEVLEVSFTEFDAFGEGGKESKNYKWYYPDYARLFELQGSAIYTVDLAYAEFKIDENSSDRINVVLPSIKVTTVIKYDTFNSVQEYSKTAKVGTTDSGATNFDNSAKKLEEKINETFKSNETLKESAREAARKQITSIVEALTNKKVNDVKFKEEGN